MPQILLKQLSRAGDDRAYLKRNMKTLTGHTPRVDVRAIRTERNKEGRNECRRRPRCIDDNNEADGIATAVLLLIMDVV